MSKQVENFIREAVKNIKEKKRKKCNLAAIKKYLEDENSLPDDLEQQLNDMVKHGLINKEETFSLGSVCKGATAAVVLEYSEESVIGECNVKHNTPKLTDLSERIKILESTLESTTKLNCSSQTSPHPIDPVIARLEKEVEFLKQEILVKNKQISSLIDSLKYSKIHEIAGNGRSSNDFYKLGCNDAHNNQSQAEKGTAMGKRLALDNSSVNRKRQMPRIPDLGKSTQEKQRTIVPGELTYAQSLKGVRVVSDERKKAGNSHCSLSMEEYPSHYNRFSPLSIDISRTTSDGRMQTESTDEGESGLSKQAALSNRQGSSASETQKQSRVYTKPTAVVLGDSLVKNIKGFKMKEATANQQNVHVYTFPGANIDDMNSHVTPTMKRNPDTIILHCGTNDLGGTDSVQTIAENIADLAKALKTNKNEVFVSGIVPRGDRFNEKAMQVNEKLLRICQREKIKFINNCNINPHEHLNRSKLHLNYEGTCFLANNFLRALGFY